MGQPRKKAPKPHETILQTIFVKRVKEELAARELSVLQFSKLIGAPKERTLADVLNAGSVPGLTVVHQCATALGVPVASLLTDMPIRNQEILTNNVRHLPRLPSVFSRAPKDRTPGQMSKRNKSRA
jgi:hypothetical protein